MGNSRCFFGCFWPKFINIILMVMAGSALKDRTKLNKRHYKTKFKKFRGNACTWWG